MALEGRISIGRYSRSVLPLKGTPIFLNRNVGLREGNFRTKVVTRFIRPFASLTSKRTFFIYFIQRHGK